MISSLAGRYQEVIMGHDRRLHNLRKPEDATRTAQGVDPLNGNELTISLERASTVASMMLPARALEVPSRRPLRRW